MSNSCVAPKKRYVFLDGCRGVAAICVMLFHSSQIFGIYTFQSAYFAVDFFFMLSGYVLYKAYYDRPRINLEQFLLLRIVRLYPNFLFGLIFGSIILYFMYGKYKLNDIVCLDDNIREFLKFKSKEVKMTVLLNYVLCNYCKHKELFPNDVISIFYINNKFKNFLVKNNKYIGDDYSIDGIKILLEEFVHMKQIIIEI